jgi:type IV secretory pathway TraG/TraD family ATPase VirD4
MSFASSFREGREEARAAREGRPRPIEGGESPPVFPSSVEDRAPDPDAPSPIRFGYHGPLNGELRDAPAALETDTELNMVVLGKTGVGKQTRIFTPLAMTTRNRSLVWVDNKAETTTQCGDELRKHHDFKVIGPFQEQDDGCNLIAHLDPDSPDFYDEVEELSAAAIEIENDGGNSKFFSERTQQWLSCNIMYEAIVAPHEKRTPDMAHVHSRLTEGDAFETKRLPDGTLQKRQIKGMQALAARMIATGHESLGLLAGTFFRETGRNELAGVLASAAREMSWMVSPRMRASTSKNGVDLRKLNCSERPMAVIIVLPAHQITSKRRWTRMLLTAALQGHMKPGKRSTLFVLDEYRAAVGQMKIISDVWSLVRGYRIQMLAVFQSALQIRALMGEEWENFPGQAGLVASLGPAGDQFTADWMSKLCGVTTELKAGLTWTDGINVGDANGDGVSGAASNLNNNSNRGRHRSATFTYQQIEHPVLLPQDLRDIRAGHGLMWTPGSGTKTIPFFAPHYWNIESEPWAARVKPNPLRLNRFR